MPETASAWLHDPTLRNLIALAVALLVVALLLGWARSILTRRIPDSKTRYRVRKALDAAAFAAVLLIAAMLFSVRLGGLAVALGVAGAGAAFALQELLASFAGWIVVLIGTYYKVGDRIQLGGVRGDVIDIGPLRTTLMELGEWVRGDLYTGRIVRVSNSAAFKEPVFNYSGEFPFLWDEITLPVTFGSDRRRARELLERVAAEVVGDYAAYAEKAWGSLVNRYMVDKARTAPAVTLAATDDWMEFTLRYVVDYTRRRATKDRLFTRILEEIDRAEGRVALASATFQLVDPPVFDVRVQQAGNAGSGH